MNSPQGIPEEKVEELLDRLLNRGHDRKNTAFHPGFPTPSTGADANCPPDTIWHGIAMRDRSGHDALPLLEHAAGCQRCGAILSFWGSILSDEQTPSESASLSRLSALTPAWQERMAGAMLASSQSSRQSPTFRGRLVWPSVLVAAGALAAAALVFIFLHGSRSEQAPERLLAQAYSDHRIMDARIPMASFAPVDPAHHVRTAAAGTLSDSVPLLEARAAITQALMKAPEDPHWLLLQARSDLLNENYDSAIETLKRLLASDPGNVAVLTDLASAYLMRAKATDTPGNNAAALDYLERAARIAPKDPVVLYNEAIVLSDLYQYMTAVDVWKRFLAVEHDKEWLADGQRRLAAIQAIQSQTRQRQSRLSPFLNGPQGMLHLARSPDLVAEYDEELSTIDLPQLLRTAFPVEPDPAAPHPEPSSKSLLPAACTTNLSCPPDASASAARVLLQATAVSLKQRHHDQWLTDLLVARPDPAFASAVNALAGAIDRGQHSHFADGLQGAQIARHLFERQKNEAGATRAAIEQVFNLQHFSEDGRCLAAAQGVPEVFARHHYPWMEAQFWGDESGCRSQQNDFAAARASLDRSLAISTADRYHINRLRTLTFIAALEDSVGNRDEAWRLDLQGLQTYWNADYPPIRASAIYSAMGYAAQASDRIYFSVLIHQENVRELESQGYPQLLNANRFLLVRSEIRAGEVQEASQDLESAEAELSASPERDVVKEVNADIGIVLAEGYLIRNDLGAAGRQLQNVAPGIAGTGNHDMELRYAAATGHLAMLQGSTLQADEELTQAIAIAERGYRETKGVQDRIDWIESARPIYAELTLLRLHQGESPIQALSIWERYRILSSGVPLQGWCRDDNLECLAQPLEAARKTLRQETILGAIRLDRSLVLWTMDDHGVRVHEVGIDPDRFDLLCHTFSEILATPHSSEAGIRFYGNRLAASLLAPVTAELDPSRTLVFDLDDSMEFLPAAALPVNRSYLGLVFATSTVHSILLADRRPSALPPPQQSIVVGASLPGDSEVPPLPEAKAEALAIAGYLTRPRIFVGPDATPDAIEAAAHHAALIHFAGHTRFVHGGTRLLLAHPQKSGPDWLDARAFRTAAFANCRLVVLSACSTGKREDRDSGDIQDIVQTLTARGAQQIVATHWDVDSAASVSLMKDFYSGLARGLTVPQAMLQAKRTVNDTAEYRHPYYWAPYYVIGISRPDLKELIHDE
jgi:CHAT domain-containing protein